MKFELIEKKKLTKEQIKDILTNLPKINNKLKKNIKNSLKKVKIYSEVYEEFKNTIINKYQRAFIEPGESVGVLAATCIGEKSTQTVLNSFHTSGIKKMEITEGLPRLNELFNVSKKSYPFEYSIKLDCK